MASEPATAFATEDGVRAAKRRKETRDHADAEVLRVILSTTQGRDWYMRLLQEVCGLHNVTANAAFDPNALHYREGARAVGLHLHREALRLVKQPYMVALAEHLR